MSSCRDSERDDFFFRELCEGYHGQQPKALSKQKHAQTVGAELSLQEVSKSIILRL